MTPDETTRVQEIRTRVEATTIGDWTAQRWAGATLRGFVAYCGENENQRVYVTPTSGNSGVWQPGGAVTDAEFIANAKQDVPFLLSLVERQAAEIARLTKNTGPDPYRDPCPASFSGGERFPKPNDVSKL